MTLAIWGAVMGVAVIAFFAYDLPSVDQALTVPARPSVTVLASDGTTLAARGSKQGRTVYVGDLPPHTIQAVLAIEDRRFYDHGGVDFIGILRAMVTNVRHGRIVQGGSTITQQAAKNLFLSPERTFRRKIQEVLLALWLERRFSKDQILTIYLNRVYFGAGQYGIEAAAQRYFGTTARNLKMGQSAILAGMLKAPSRLNPARNLKAAQARARVVLRAMVDAGFISDANLSKTSAVSRTAARPTLRPGAPHFVDWVEERLAGYLGPHRGPVTVRTTLDPAVQRSAASIVAKRLNALDRKHKRIEAGFVALAPDGAVRAMIGGRNYRKSQFNRATQSRRQPGSAFKPLVYLAGLQAGMTPETRIKDVPLTIGNWRPKNYDGKFRGEMTLAAALAQSVNTVAVRVSESAGREQVATLARRLGISIPAAPGPSIALGAIETSLIELTAAYGAFANGGRPAWPYAIVEITDGDGQRLYRRTGDGPGPVVDLRHLGKMNDMMAGVIRRGTGRNAAINRPVGGKTGTSQNFRDAWFIGYSADLVAGVWIGRDDNAPMAKITGGGLPALIWRDVMRAAHRGLPVRPLPGTQQPPGGPILVKGESTGGGFWHRLLQTLGAS